MDAYEPFDRRMRRLRRERAPRSGGDADYLLRRAADELLERLESVKREFRRALVLGSGDPSLARRLREQGIEVVAADAGAGLGDVQCDEDRLPFGDGAFDLVVCQFGIMFFPDKVAGNREARRVLRGGGRYLLVIWDEVARNAGSQAISDAVAALFPDDPPRFIDRTPFGYADPARIEHDLLAAGFTDIEFETVEKRSRLPSARDAAIGMCMGSPLRSEIEERDPAMLERAVEAATAALARWEGPNGFDAPMSAHIVTATK